MNCGDYMGIIKSRLTEKRFYHSCMVSKKAKELASRYGEDPAKAETAGLLHDIAKDDPGPVQLQTMAKYSIILDNVERCTPKLWHAIAGEAILRNELMIGDEEILLAVRYHTTARAGMSKLEKIVYLADFVSADRDFEGVAQLRQAVDTSLEAGFAAALDFSIKELLSENAPVHLDTVRARNERICGD